MWAVGRIIGEDARHILVLQVRLVARVPGADRNGSVPALSTIARAAHKDPVTASAVSPIGRSSKFIKCQVGDVRVALVIEGGRNVASAAPVRWRDHTCWRERASRVE